MKKNGKAELEEYVEKLSRPFLSPLDLLPHSDFREKCIDLVLNGIPGNFDHSIIADFHELRRYLVESEVGDVRVVVFGGGTGLSNIIGGDSRRSSWPREPFAGLKEIFPRTQSIVCVTDDGGSTGELIKDLPIIALGDIRHVLLSSIQLQLLQKRYSITLQEAQDAVDGLASILNFRFLANEITRDKVTAVCQNPEIRLPSQLESYIAHLVDTLFSDNRLSGTLSRSHCLGNLLLVAAMDAKIEKECDNSRLENDRRVANTALYAGIDEFSYRIGTVERAVLPCTTTPSQLRICYTNGVQVTGESKSGDAERGFPVDRVVVDFSDTIHVPPQIFKDIEAADIIIMAPGSLYSSIIPIFQVPGIAEAVRRNKPARKLLISNLWVQAGETDIAISDPERKFYVSDMIRAYERNIPGGTRDLFHEVFCLSLKDVPASVIQNYTLEGKIPIYLDRHIVCDQGYLPIECGIYSKKALAERGVIQHDPEILAQAVKTVFIASRLQKKPDCSVEEADSSSTEIEPQYVQTRNVMYPSRKYRVLESFIQNLPISFSPEEQKTESFNALRSRIIDIIWKHQDISLDHLVFIRGIVCIAKEKWRREQIWDKVFSFFDPEDGYIKIRSDLISDFRKLEVGILIAIGQSLLGNYAKEKRVEEVTVDGVTVGKIYHLHVRGISEIEAFFTSEEIDRYLHFAKMIETSKNDHHFTRLINGNDGFTPPGVLMGLTYAWYLDNRLASHIEYKMALMKIGRSDLIPEQQKMLERRNSMVDFFREVVFSG